MIRKFYLENEHGVKWSLNSPSTGLLTSPDGLGYGLEVSYAAIGYSFVRNYMKEQQQEISGILVFGTKTPYLACGRFLEFANAAVSLRLVYKTDAGEYYRDVDLVKLTKTEIARSGALECNVSFMCKGLFYSNQTNRFLVSRSDGELRWDFTWPARFNDYGNRKVIINNSGHIPAPFEMEIYGYCENPRVHLVQDGTEMAKVIFPVILQENEKILYSSVDGNLYCFFMDADGNMENFADMLDINHTNFFKFPLGESVMEFTSDTGAANKTLLTVYRFYRAV